MTAPVLPVPTVTFQKPCSKQVILPWKIPCFICTINHSENCTGHSKIGFFFFSGSGLERNVLSPKCGKSHGRCGGGK